MTLSVRANDECGGQIDVKAVFVGSGQSRGRLAGPYVTIPACKSAPGVTTTTPTTTLAPSTTTQAPPSTTPATQAPSSTVEAGTVTTTVAPAVVPPPAPTTSGPAVLAEQARPAGTALPVTGRDETGPMVAGGLSVLLGALLMASAHFGRRRALRRLV